MVPSSLARCVGIAVLLAGLFGLFVLGGAGWSLDVAVAADSSGIDDLVLFQEVDLDLGAEYRDSESSPEASSAADATGTAAVANGPGITDALFRPSDPSAEVRIGGLRFLHFVSLVGAALVGIRALLGWRLDGRAMALEPRGSPPVGDGDEGERRTAPLRERRPQSRE